MCYWRVFLFFLIVPLCADAQRYDTLGLGWSRTTVNTVVFRKNSLTSDGAIQYAAWYDSVGRVILGMRTDGKWRIKTTSFTGHVADAHNSISIMTDGEGYLHMAWDHHGHPLRYTRSVEPRSLDMGAPRAMIGTEEKSVTYPEFYRLANGNLIFLYRDGQSGKGNLVMNSYETATKRWRRLHSNLIDGESERNAYWQAYTDARGTIHLSWVWREEPDVASNRDMAYARSRDGGQTWERSDGSKYPLPINAANAEYAVRIPMNSELINQTSMTATADGRPVIASYWRAPGGAAPQYHIVYHDGKQWKQQQVTRRTLDFTLRGGGTKRIPISRPQVMVTSERGRERLLLIYRDEERGNKVTVAESRSWLSAQPVWEYRDITTTGVGQWEPTFDSELWRSRGKLALFVQRTGQGDGERMENIPPQPVVIMYPESSDR